MFRPAHKALRWVMPELSTALVSEAARLGLLDLADRLPEFGGTQYLECRLGNTVPESTQVDFLVSLTKFQAQELGEALEERVGNEPGMKALHRLVRDWGSSTSILHRLVPVTWLEFDHADRQTSPAASICPCFVPSYVDPFAPPVSAPCDEVVSVVGEAARVVCRSDAALDELEYLGRCIGELPSGAHWIHLSIMTAREPLQLKLYGCFPQATVPSYLRAIGWAGDIDRIERLLARYCPRERTANVAWVDLPLTGMFDPDRAGLGICFNQQQLKHADEEDPRRPCLLSDLVDDGLCTPEKRAALSGWPGRRVLSSANVGLPAAVTRWFDVKLVYRARQALTAKAYLGFFAKTTLPALRFPSDACQPE